MMNTSINAITNSEEVTLLKAASLQEALYRQPEVRTTPTFSVSGVPFPPEGEVFRLEMSTTNRVRPEVVASLERSLVENAEVWAELSKF